jgi:hypothetical protein
MRRTTSAYFGFCNSHHVPDVTDLVVLEFDVDDPPYVINSAIATGLASKFNYTPSDQETMVNFELLVRSLLIRPDQPAVVILGHFSPQTHDTYGYSGPDHWHTIVAQFYDVPHIRYAQ